MTRITNTVLAASFILTSAAFADVIGPGGRESAPAPKPEPAFHNPADLSNKTLTPVSDGRVTVEDLMFFINAWLEGDKAADLDDGNGEGETDGAVTIEDLLYFLAWYSIGSA